MPVLRLGTRKSPMAMIQAGHVAELIRQRTGADVELVGLTTFGDVTRANLPDIGGTGVFVSALRESLLAGDVDLAVHSLKDLPTAAMPGITLAAVPARDDPRDALAGRDGAKLADLPPGATIGTGSPRRAAQLLLLRPGIRPVPIRGNAGTGLAGLLALVDDPGSRAAVTAERTVLAELQAGCSAPLGALAAGTGMLHLTAVVVAEDGGLAVRASQSGAPSRAEELGRDVAAELLRLGAGTIVADPAVTSTGDDA